MTKRLYGFSREDILMLAPNTIAAVNAQRFAQPNYWGELSANMHGIVLQGKFNNHANGKVRAEFVALRIKVDGFSCFCASRMPCEHILGLLLLRFDYPELFGASDTEFQQPAPTITNPDHRTVDDIRGSLNHLERWLIQLIRQGIAEPQVRTFAFWDEIINRMWGAQLTGMAIWLQDAASIAVRGSEGWVESLLDELGRMYLLVRSFERFEQLPAESQADMRDVIGWWLPFPTLPAPEVASSADGQIIHDGWVVLGQHQRALREPTVHTHHTSEQLTWLYGMNTHRMALIQSLGDVEMLRTNILLVGQVIEADLRVMPSRSPLKTWLIRLYGEASPSFDAVHGVSIPEAVKAFGTALARNPWLRHYPVLLDNVHISRFDKGWIVCHADGNYLPIAPHFPHKWALYALHGGHPIQLAATWDGQHLYPLSAITSERFINLNQVMRYKEQPEKTKQKAP